jgi:hypothetical protein
MFQSELDAKVCLYWFTTDKIKLIQPRTIQLKTEVYINPKNLYEEESLGLREGRKY